MSIADKIAKIIAKADSSTSPAEAATFMAKAEQMMREHGINLMELGRLSEDPIDVQRDAIVLPRSYVWMRQVASAAAGFYGVDFIGTKRGTKEYFTISGRESNRITFTLMMPFIIRQVRALGRKSHKAGYHTSGAQADTRIGNALAERIWDMCTETKKHEGTGINALVPVDLMTQLLADMFPDSKEPKPKKMNTDLVAERLAKEVNINLQTAAHGHAAKLPEAK